MHVVTISVPQLGNRCHLVHDGRSALVDRPAARPAAGRGGRRGGRGRRSTRSRTPTCTTTTSRARPGSRRRHRRRLPAQRGGAGGRRPGRGARRRRGPASAGSASGCSTPPATPVHHQSFLVRGTDPRRAGRAVQRRQPAARHRRPHRPRRPAAHPAPRPGPVGERPPAGRAGRRHLLHPTHGFGSFCAGGRRPDPTATPRSRASGHANPAAQPGARRVRRRPGRGLRPGAGVLPHGWRRSTGAGAGADRPADPRPLTAAETDAVRRVGGWVIDVRSARGARRGRPARARVSIPYSDQFATWTSAGWCRGATPLVLVDPPDRRPRARRCATCTGSASSRSAPTCSAARPCREPALLRRVPGTTTAAAPEQPGAARRAPARRGRGRSPARRAAHPAPGPAGPAAQPPARASCGCTAAAATAPASPRA